jgi:hypothetical protein
MANTNEFEDLTDEEIKLISDIEATGNWDDYGAVAGSALGAGAGAALLATPLAPIAPFAIPVLMGLGQQAGSAIGGTMGSAEATKLQSKFDKSMEGRTKRQREQAAKMESFNRLLGKYSSF